jgi:putative endonuclease
VITERRRLGDDGEERAAVWYRQHNYQVLDRNWRSGRLGEIDLVVFGNSELVVVEVKTRTSDRFGSPAESITPTKQRRLRQLAASYASAHPDLKFSRIRFDVVAILGSSFEVLVDIF